jgi:hypothetical protein
MVQTSVAAKGTAEIISPMLIHRTPLPPRSNGMARISSKLSCGRARRTATQSKTATITQTAIEMSKVNQVNGKIACARTPAALPR